MKTTKTYIKTHIELVLASEISSLEETLIEMYENDYSFSRDYAIMNKKLKVLKRAAKKLAKLSAKRQALWEKRKFF